MNVTQNNLWDQVAFSVDNYESWRPLRSGAVVKGAPSADDSSVDTLIHRREQLTLTAARGGVRIEPTVVLPPRRIGRRSFVSTARWEGSVVELFSSYFVADVIDLASGEPAAVEFDLDEVTPADRHLCEPGALFYWTTGYETKDSGQRSRVSVITFRRTGKGAEAD